MDKGGEIPGIDPGIDSGIDTDAGIQIPAFPEISSPGLHL
jgi:hypothetical protein